MTVEPRTETQALEQRITDALVTIRREWPHMLPTGPPPVRTGTGQSARITADDHATTGADIDPGTRLVSLRREVVDTLNGWTRVVMEDRPVTKALPDVRSAGGMCVFLERHAQWMSGHEAAEDMAGEVEALARSVKAVTQPQRREWMSLGSCPLEIEQDTDDGLVMVTCGGQVRAWPRHTDEDGQVMARCRRCGVEAVAPWWEARMFDDPELKVMLTDAEVVGFVHRAYGKVIDQATVRQWVTRKIIQPSGTQDGRRVFDRHALVWALDLKERREAMGL